MDVFKDLGVSSQRDQREIIPVHVIREVEDAGETGPGVFDFVPIAGRLLRIEQVGDAALDGFANRARNWSRGDRDVYVLMINGAKVRAPAAALAMQQRLGIERAAT